ncbi:MAG: hypothetical protein HYZ63_01095 [Candidatus Andersenbacteria bacterium]|nr:hypothetical protein [Candidatus Andersenbacteria bacterium]
MKAIDWTPIFKKYKGKWVALEDDEVTVISSGLTLKSTLGKAHKRGYKNPILFRVPTKIVLRVGEAQV